MEIVGERVGQWDGECWCGRMEIVGAGVGRRDVNIGAVSWKTAWRAEGMRTVQRMVRRTVCGNRETERKKPRGRERDAPGRGDIRLVSTGKRSFRDQAAGFEIKTLIVRVTHGERLARERAVLPDGGEQLILAHPGEQETDGILARRQTAHALFPMDIIDRGRRMQHAPESKERPRA